MPATLGGQWSIIGIALVGIVTILRSIAWLGDKLVKMVQWMEMTTKANLLVYRATGREVPAWLADGYKKLNGNAKVEKEELRDLLGDRNVPPSGPHKAAKPEEK